MQSRLAAIALMATAMFLVAGCAPADSVYPLYKPSDTSSDDRLAGTWQPTGKDATDAEKNQRWTFARSKDDKFYEFTLGTSGQKGGFATKVRLVGIGNYMFVDFTADFDRINPNDEKMDNLVPYPAIPTHGIGRIWIDKDSLRIHFLRDDWVKDQMKAGKLTLAHPNVGGDCLITATTDELRNFMMAHANDTDALSESYDLQRAK